eukprot:1151281-Alexandrium_andersonii.AAC.1
MPRGELNDPDGADPSVLQQWGRRYEIDRWRMQMALPEFTRRRCRVASAYRNQGLELVVGQSLQVGADQAEEEKQWSEQ